MNNETRNESVAGASPITDQLMRDGGMGAEFVALARQFERENAELRRSISEASPKWIPVGERLPEQRRRSVLVHCAERRNTYTAYLDEDDNPNDDSPWRHFGGDGGYVRGVTHWMPLPEAPK